MSYLAVVPRGTTMSRLASFAEEQWGLVTRRQAEIAATHEFTLPTRRQSRRRDVRLHIGEVDDLWINLRGLPVTQPSRIAADLLREREDPEAVAYIVADAIRAVYDYPGTFAETLAPAASQLGLRRGDGMSVLRWLLDLVGDPLAAEWLTEAAASLARGAGATKP